MPRCERIILKYGYSKTKRNKQQQLLDSNMFFWMQNNMKFHCVS